MPPQIFLYYIKLQNGNTFAYLSTDVETARKVGMRHGKPVILVVDALVMYQEGFTFYCSDNRVYLVDHVPPEYLHIMN